jgi:hypothetical protein
MHSFVYSSSRDPTTYARILPGMFSISVGTWDSLRGTLGIHEFGCWLLATVCYKQISIEKQISINVLVCGNFCAILDLPDLSIAVSFWQSIIPNK